MKFKSLRGKLVFAITSLVVVVVVITGVVQYYQSWSQIFSEFQKRILSIAQTAASNVDGDEHALIVDLRMEDTMHIHHCRNT